MVKSTVSAEWGGGGRAPRKRNCAEPMCGFQTHEKVLEALGVLSVLMVTIL